MANEGNLIANRTAEVLLRMHQRGRFWSVENPADSYIWELKSFKKLAELSGATAVFLDQCCYGSEFTKPTRILTNAPWMFNVAQRCPGRPEHPKHPSLEGKVWDYTQVPPVQCWYTSLAAEYPSGLCWAWATGLKHWIGEKWEAVQTAGKLVRPEGNPFKLVRLTTTDTNMADQRPEHKKEETESQRRERENAECIGGL